MKKILTVFLLAMGLSSPFALGHSGGHAHKGQVRAPKGGMIQELKNGTESLEYVEVVNQKKILKLYFYDHDLNTVKYDKIKKIKVTARIPRKKGVTKLSVDQKDGAWITSFDAKRAHRYILEVSVNSAAAKFNIEPK